MTGVPQKIRAFAAVDAFVIAAMAYGAFATSDRLLTHAPDRVVVYRQNSVIAEYPLKDDIAFTVNGSRGPLDVEIKNGAAAIIHVNCPRKTCRQFGAIRRSREQLICAPNNILIEIRSSNGDGGIDGVTY